MLANDFFFFLFKRVFQINNKKWIWFTLKSMIHLIQNNMFLINSSLEHTKFTRFLIGIFYCCIISIVIFISNKQWAAQKAMELNQAKIQPSNQLHLNNLKTKHRTHHQLRNQQQLQTQTHRQQSQQL